MVSGVFPARERDSIDSHAPTALDASSNQPKLALYILLAIYVLSAMDRQMMAVLAEPIKADLGISDTQLGLLTGFAFAFLYAIAGVPLAWLSDRTNRRSIIGICCLLWSFFTATCGLAGSFLQMAAARMAVGIGEAGGTAPSMALIADYFPPNRRARALAVFTLGVPIGVALGGFFGGFVSAYWDWRAAFVAAGALGLLVAPLLLLLRDPKRGGFDAAPSAPFSMRDAMRLYRDPVLMLVALSGGATAFAGQAILNWAPAFLMRSQGMTLAEIGIWYGPTFGFALGFGVWAGGMLVDRLSARSGRVYPLVPALAGVLAIPAFAAGLAVTSWLGSLFLIATASLLLMMYMPPMVALLQNRVPSGARGTVIAVYVLAINLIGLGCGPAYTGLMSDLMAPTYGAESLHFALSTVAGLMVVPVIGFLLLDRAMRRSKVPTQPG